MHLVNPNIAFFIVEYLYIYLLPSITSLKVSFFVKSLFSEVLNRYKKVCVGLRREKTSQAGRVLFHQFYSKRDR